MTISDILDSDSLRGAYFPIETLSPPIAQSWETTAKIAALTLASYLTDPICKVREYFYTFYILHKTCTTTVQKVTQIVLLTLGIGIYALLTPITTPLGVALRGAVATFQSKPYIYLKRAPQGKTLPPDQKITIVSHNQCYVQAGYSLTDGQVTPPSDGKRLQANIAMTKRLNPDILCIYEVADIRDAAHLSSWFPEYPFIIPVAGVRAIGPSSMMYIASKYEIVEDSIEFVPFIKNVELTGPARFSEKGFLSFDIKNPNAKEPFATILSTHLQHSEVPGKPTKSEEASRALQWNRIEKQIEKKANRGYPVIGTGDFNELEEKFQTLLNQNEKLQLRRDPSIEGQPTWGGDQWWNERHHRPVSGPQILDYTFVTGKTAAIKTRIVGTGYSGEDFLPEATSDHKLLFSTVTIPALR